MEHFTFFCTNSLESFVYVTFRAHFYSHQPLPVLKSHTCLVATYWMVPVWTSVPSQEQMPRCVIPTILTTAPPNSFVPVFFCFAYLYNLNFRLIQPPQCQRQLHSYALASPLSCSEALVHTSFLSYPDNNNQNFTTQSCTVFNL